MSVMEWLSSEYEVTVRSTEALQAAAQTGLLAMIAWLVDQHGCVVDATVCTSAVEVAVATGSTATLEWLRDNGHLTVSEELYVPLFNTAVTEANSGRVRVLRWLHETAHCPWDAELFAHAAAALGLQDCLAYIHERGGPFSAAQLKEQLDGAGRNRRLSSAEWLKSQQGAAWPDGMQTSWPSDMLLWAMRQGWCGTYFNRN